MKKNILWFILGGLVFGTIGVGAAYVYTARDINYQPSDENWSVDNVQEAISELKTDVNIITNKVEGIERVYKAGEVELVALVSDDSFYTDSNGKYVLANSDTGRSLLADTSTYKSLASTEDCIGEVGADTASPFNGNDKTVVLSNVNTYIQDVILLKNQMPKNMIFLYVNTKSGATNSDFNDYISVQTLGKGGTPAWAEISIYAKLAGKYAVKGSSTSIDTIVTVSANDLILKCATNSEHSLPVFNGDYPLTIQYLGNY